MSEGIKMMIVRSLLLELSMGVIHEKLKHLHGFVRSRQGLYAFRRQWQSRKELRRTREICNGAVKLKKFHLKFMDMWLAKNNELTTWMLKKHEQFLE